MKRNVKARARRPGQPRTYGPRLALIFVPVAIAAVIAALVILARGGDAGEVKTSDAAGVPAASPAVEGVVAERSSVDLGHVPLDTPVKYDFTLRNTGTERVSVGPPRIEVLEGC
jgi:hypothetical protein